MHEYPGYLENLLLICAIYSKYLKALYVSIAIILNWLVSLWHFDQYYHKLCTIWSIMVLHIGCYKRLYSTRTGQNICVLVIFR